MTSHSTAALHQSLLECRVMLTNTDVVTHCVSIKYRYVISKMTVWMEVMKSIVVRDLVIMLLQPISQIARVNPIPS